MLTKIRNRISDAIRPSAKPQSGERNYTASKAGRLSMDWILSPTSSDAAMNGHMVTIRTRARDLERNNEWARGFLRVLENNVIGEAGISLQLRVRDASGKLDEVANDIIETAWWRWGKYGGCTVCGRYSWRELQLLIIRTIARDGEMLLRKVITKAGLKLQVIEPDLLDDTYNATLAGGNEVRLGVEMDGDRRVVAYYFLTQHPGDMGFAVSRTGAPRMRIPAEEIFHLYKTERPGQSRGISWFASVMQRLKMLDGYAEAELVAARTGAAKMGFFEKQTPDGWSGEVDGDGNLSMDASPGTIEELPMGVRFKAWESDHPNSGYGTFVKSCLRGVAASLGISYNTFSSDLEGVNYSSIRAGLIEEREVWKGMQSFLIERFCEPLFSAWLEVELLRGALAPLPASKMWKFDVPEFRGRRWSWVDPKKDMEAAILAIRSGQKSLRQSIAEGGGDIITTLTEISDDEKLVKSLGIRLPELEADKDTSPQVDTEEKEE